jgi:hypothetical protein
MRMGMTVLLGDRRTLLELEETNASYLLVGKNYVNHTTPVQGTQGT